MAPSKKSRSINKRFSYINDVSHNKSGENGNKSRQKKRKLADMLGSQWNKEELERFYKAYQKHGKDWEKVAATVHNRSAEMVEALYTMNTAYLSLPKGYASAAGFIAMMTDHYANMEDDSDNEREISDSIGVSQKPQNCSRGTKGVGGPSVADLLNSQPTEASYSCLSLLKKRRSVSKPWAVGKRTPRVPVSYAGDKDNGEKYPSPICRSLKSKVDNLDDDVACELALALTEASKGGCSPKISQARKLKPKTSAPVQNGARVLAGPAMISAKLWGNMMDDGSCALSLESTEADTGDYAGGRRALKGKKYCGKTPEEEESIDNCLDDMKEACSGTEEGEKVNMIKGKVDMGISNKKLARSSNKGLRKRSKKAFFEQGEDPTFHALQALADLSLRLPEKPFDTESSVHAVEENAGIVAKPKVKGNHSSPGAKTAPIKRTKLGKASPHDLTTNPEKNVGTHQINDATQKRRQKSLPSKISENDDCTDAHLVEYQKAEGDLSCSDVQNNIGLGKAVSAQQALNGQPLVHAQIQAQESAIHALSELTHALEKKEALLYELKRLNDEVLESQNDGQNSLKDSELFKKYYASVLLQLNEINEQVSSYLFCLRQCNKYQGNILFMQFKPMGSVGELDGHYSSLCSSKDDTQETGCHAAEIVETSRTRAWTMVNVAVQAMSSLKKEDNRVESITEVIDFINNHLSADDVSMPTKGSSTPASTANHGPTPEDQLSSCISVGTVIHASDTESKNLFNQNSTKMPSELIAQCLATLLVIQKCTERQFPPSDVAQVLDSAVTSLKPCCSQNLPIYAEVQKCMGIIRSQILALVPT